MSLTTTIKLRSGLTDQINPISGLTDSIKLRSGIPAVSANKYRLWYKADAITGLVNNDPVGTWADSSINLENLAQAVAGNKPTYLTNQLNSLPVVSLDGSNDKMSISSQVFNAISKMIVMIVVKVDSLVTIGKAIVSYGTFNSDWAFNISKHSDRIIVYIPSSLPDNGITGAQGTVPSYFPDTTSFVRIGVLYDGTQATNADRLKIYKDGVVQSINFTGTIPATSQSLTDTTFRIGNGVSGHFGGDISDIIVEDKPITVAHLLELDVILKNKYAL